MTDSDQLRTLKVWEARSPFAAVSVVGILGLLVGCLSPREEASPRSHSAYECITNGDNTNLSNLVSAETVDSFQPPRATTPLTQSIRCSNRGACRILVEAGANVNLSDTSGLPPLMVAILKGDRKVVSLLLEHGADSNRTVYYKARLIPVLSYTILKRGDDLPIVKLLCRNGADVNAESAVPPLYAAAMVNARRVASYLLDMGARVAGLGQFGTTCLGAAVAHGSKDVGEILIKHGADVNAVNGVGARPLDAVESGGVFKEEMFQLLVSHGADVNALDASGGSFLHGADSPAFAAALVKKGASLDVADVDGNTPLMAAILRERTDVALFLISAGADLGVRNRVSGKAALGMAREMKNKKVAEAIEVAIRSGENDGGSGAKQRPAGVDL